MESVSLVDEEGRGEVGCDCVDTCPCFSMVWLDVANESGVRVGCNVGPICLEVLFINHQRVF